MNIKSIIVGSLALGLALGGTLLNLSSEDDKQSAYTPLSLNNATSGQKDYAEYMHSMKEDPATGKIDLNLVSQVRNEIAARGKQSNKSALGINWTQMGPDNVGGRTRAVLVDRNNPNIVYAGSVAGGLFVSTDGTQNWTPVAGHQGVLGENLAVSCIAQTDDGRIFFGTGSTFETPTGNQGSTPGFIGNGVYEYVPATGAVLPIITNTGSIPNNSIGSQWSYCNAIAAKGTRLYLGTRDGLIYADPVGGNYPTLLTGWTNPIDITPVIKEKGTVQDIDIASDGSMTVCLANKLYTSNTGNTGSFVSRTLLGSSRVMSAIAPSDPNWIYLVRITGTGTLNSFEISRDKGQNWEVIVPGGANCFDPFLQNDCDPTGGQGGYDACIAVDPSDRGHVLVGGIQLFEWQYNASSNPIGGSWLKAANLFESASNPFYVHADKHTIVWPTAGTVYIGGDGGVFRSIDGGNTWQERNLGYNVTTFFDVATSANGWFVGGAQDNGCQMFTYGATGEVSPLGATEVSGGDGFDCSFSRLGGGIVFTTSQYGTLYRSNGGALGQFYDQELTGVVSAGQPFHTVIENWESTNDLTSVDSVKIMIDSTGLVTAQDSVLPGGTIMAGDTIYYSSLTNGEPLMYVVPSNIVLGTPNDSIVLQDPIQSRFVLNTSSGVYLTKDATRFNAINTEWFRVTPNQGANCFEFSPDGSHLFIGTNGGVKRLSGLNLANDSLGLDHRSGSEVTTLTPTFATGTSGRITGIACDPNNADNMIVVVSGYTTGNHVFRSTNATTALTFTPIQGIGAGALPKMPVFDCEIDFTDNNKVIIGTEWGVWTTDNAFATIPTQVAWNDESGNAGHVPVWAVEQQHLRSHQATNAGAIYLGTHGRGFYMSTDLVTSIDESEFEELADNGFVSNLTVYPNPMNNVGSVEFTLADRGNTSIKIYNLSGAIVKEIELGAKAKGAHKEQIDVSALSIGSYIVSLESGSERSIAKFVVTR